MGGYFIGVGGSAETLVEVDGSRWKLVEMRGSLRTINRSSTSSWTLVFGLHVSFLFHKGVLQNTRDSSTTAKSECWWELVWVDECQWKLVEWRMWRLVQAFTPTFDGNFHQFHGLQWKLPLYFYQQTYQYCTISFKGNFPHIHLVPWELPPYLTNF